MHDKTETEETNINPEYIHTTTLDACIHVYEEKNTAGEPLIYENDRGKETCRLEGAQRGSARGMLILEGICAGRSFRK